MKKKFDFTAEMKEVQVTKSTPQNEYLEEEKRLLGINVKELAELNGNVYGLRTDLTALVDLLAYIIHSGFISGYQNRYGDNLKPPTNVYHRMTA